MRRSAVLITLLVSGCFVSSLAPLEEENCGPLERFSNGECVPKCHTAAGESECGDVCCAASERCNENTCEPAPPCETDELACGGDCCDSETQICYNGACTDREPGETCTAPSAPNSLCQNNDDCQNDTRCVSGLCIPFLQNDPSCAVEIPQGVFRPEIQCEWQPDDSLTPCELLNADGTPLIGNPKYPRGLSTPQCPGREVCVDPNPDDEDLARVCIDPSRQVLSTPMVISFSFPPGSQGNPNDQVVPSLVFPTYDALDGHFSSSTAGGVLRIVDGATCETLYTIEGIDPETSLPLFTVASSAVALGDINNSTDKRPEIIAHAQGGGLWAFTYDEAQDRFRALWHSKNPDGSLNFHNRGNRSVDAFGFEFFDISHYSAPAIHDLDGGAPEILMSAAVFGADGVVRFDASATMESDFRFVDYIKPPRFSITGQFPVVADVDLDGLPELVSGDTFYDWTSNGTTGPGAWVPSPMFVREPLGFDGYTALANFGDFSNTSSLDHPEIVVVNGDGGGGVIVQTIEGQIIFGPFKIPGGGMGGPPITGDFDGDGSPEFAVAGGRAYTVFDLECASSAPRLCTNDSDCILGEACPSSGRCSKTSVSCEDIEGSEDCPEGELCVALSAQRSCAPIGCQGNGFRWSQLSQDLSSNRTGSSLFDFEADGVTEAIYADECYTRVYNGQDGTVLFSQFHTSCTWNENPIIADIDGDFRAELAIGSNESCNFPAVCFNNALTVSVGEDGEFGSDDDVRVDPIFPGLRCLQDSDCPGGPCVESLCRCQDDEQCGGEGDMVCAPIIANTTNDTSRVCRTAFRRNSLDGRPGITGVRVYNDAEDRWVNSRPIWNQHTYSITNINDDGSIPSVEEQLNNWEVVGLNNFRQNTPGVEEPALFPDLTVASNGCECSEAAMTPSVRVCNRGAQEVSAGVSVAFYEGSAPSPEALRCQTQTTGPLLPGECEAVSCELSVTSIDLIVVVDDDGAGQGARAECRELNNAAVLTALQCTP